MSAIILIIYFVGMYIRGIASNISNRNESALRKDGAEEYGQKNSKILADIYYVFFTGSMIEAGIRGTQFDTISIYGLIVYAFGLSMLFFVIRQLSGMWTLKLILAKNHVLNNNFIFKYVKHPNYYFNLIPEFVGFAVICHSWFVLCSVLPVFLVVLVWRIIIEEKMMRSKFEEY